jgi:cytochrome c oxidase subunit 2
MWIEPREAGLYVGQCAQYCGTQHAKMLLRVYVDTTAQFDRWVQGQRLPALRDPAVTEGRRIFDSTACVNCHTVTGSGASGRFGPDLTHLMSRDTLASGAAPNTRSYLRQWIQNPGTIKPGALMPAMNLGDEDLDRVTAYMLTLH